MPPAQQRGHLHRRQGDAQAFFGFGAGGPPARDGLAGWSRRACGIHPAKRLLRAVGFGLGRRPVQAQTYNRMFKQIKHLGAFLRLRRTRFR